MPYYRVDVKGGSSLVACGKANGDLNRRCNPLSGPAGHGGERWADATRASAEGGAYFGVQSEPCQYWPRMTGVKIFCQEVAEFRRLRCAGWSVFARPGWTGHALVGND